MDDKIIPFFWHHGESEEVILAEINKVYECGIRAICVESRPHPDFCGETWWKDLGYILAECKKRNMRVWLLDECHYPTGSANGMSLKRPDLQPLNIMMTQMSVFGSEKCAKICLKAYHKEENLICALAFPYRNEKIVYEEGVDLTDNVYDDILYWDVPEGNYRVVAMYTSHTCSEWKFLDMMRPEAARFMIDEVYQPHYEHFSEYFGDTFVGFFSDEPRLANGIVAQGVVRAPYRYRGLGVFGVTYPWKKNILKTLNVTDNRLLYALWQKPWNKAAADFRVKYMDFVTEQYAKNFSDTLGEWCDEHGVTYSGHIIEDEGAHTRTACSTGHYFKSMRGQHIAGIDIVYNQVKAKFGDEFYLPNRSEDGRKLNYSIAKLASSAAHIEKRKNGRALCEIFGAYGWGEGIQEMKWLVDFMIARGVNHFIPHAFNPKIDDTDSPPYFYNGGANPQFDSFKTLMSYTNRLCEYFSDGKVDVRVALLYHAEAEWSGMEYMPVDEVSRCLTRKQIEFDIIPEYAICKMDESGVYTETNRYDLLIIPYREYFGERLSKMLDSAKNRRKIFKTEDDLRDLSIEIPYRLETPNPDVRIYRYEKGSETLYFVFNESAKRCRNKLIIKENGYCISEDVQTGFCETGKTDGGISLDLEEGESRVLHVRSGFIEERHYCFLNERELKPIWKIEVSEGGFENWRYYKTTDENIDIAGKRELPCFAGKIRYSATFNVEEPANVRMRFPIRYCGLQAKLNNKYLGDRIGEPYEYDVKLLKGENKLEFILTTTLGLQKRDEYTHESAIGKYGLTDYIKLRYYKYITGENKDE